MGGVHSLFDSTDSLLVAMWMKYKTYSLSTLDVSSTIILSDDMAYKHNVVIVSLCRNPDGFLWAGDTAQTISIGSTFSFNELGSFVYRYQVCDFEVPYVKLTIFSEINPSGTRNSESPKGFSVTRELPLPWWHRQVCQRHHPTSTTIPRRHRRAATGSRCCRQSNACIFP